ncbi:acyl-CoA N-acyltransferase [Ilyonectria robusta]|uniref:acyl-CoA N-acyltransferase n=1 Tax=Ilyonectria robusta TaxID=1079257 RepID=UPI001E8E9E40|nr:acyl-CoA N-acyltransferase [Ilyonectria robusta]KAH8688363.1 acyl-CoA N-acyltransferase [Ilyonectria robusta]
MSLPVGPLVSGTSTKPSKVALHGRYISLVPLQSSHAVANFKHLGGEENAQSWTHMFGGPYLDTKEWQETIDKWSASTDPLYFTVLSGLESDPNSEPVGLMTYMSIFPDHRRIEIGSIILGKVLQQTRGATEAFYLILKHAFEDLNYLRVEWKANNLNKPSLSAAERLGFVFEGIFRKHMVIKGRRRDTAWFSITDEEWPVVKQGLEGWLSENNFDEQGKQRKSLKEIRQSF